MVQNGILCTSIIFCVVIRSIQCEGTKSTNTATSSINFIQFQPAQAQKVHTYDHDNVGSSGQLESTRTEYSKETVDPFTARRREYTQYAEDNSENSVPKNYAFSYAIKDRNTGDDFSHTQAHNGRATRGEYRVKLPDGRTQIVTYTADEGGYRADIRYDKDEVMSQEQSDNSHAYISNTPRSDFYNRMPQYVAPRPPARLNSVPHTDSPKVFKKRISNSRPTTSATVSPLIHYNEIRTFGSPTTTGRPASYETVENVDEEQFPYSKKLVDDVNYLLQYVTPTVESKTEQSPKFSYTPQNDQRLPEGKLFIPERTTPSELNTNKPFELPANFPYKFPQEKAKESAEYSPANYNTLRPSVVPKYDESFDTAQLKVPPGFGTPSYSSGENYDNMKYSTPEYAADPVTNAPPLQRPLSQTEIRNQIENDAPPPRIKFANIEIPQYIHIHRYETSGEDPNSVPRPKELIYYNPVRVPVPNSVAYQERGNFNSSAPQRSTFTPSYITMTEHPRVTADIPAYFREHVVSGDSNAFEPSVFANNYTSGPVTALDTYPETKSEISTPSISAEVDKYVNADYNNYDVGIEDDTRNSPPLSPFVPPPPPPPTPSQHITSNDHSYEHHDNYANTIGGMPPFDPRVYSGYFDFLPSTELKDEKHTPAQTDYHAPYYKQQAPPNYNEPYYKQQEPPNYNEYYKQQEPPNYNEYYKQQEVPNYNEQAPTPPNAPLPQYYYDFATATPAHRYVSSEVVGSQESPMSFERGSNVSSFRSSAYLRPLHKERVYIHHNSQPTMPTSDDFFPTTTIRPSNKKQESEVTIVKSISSTIPSELLKDFDHQLSSSMVQNEDNYGAGNAPRTTTSVTAAAAAATVAITESNAKLHKNIVKKLQSALSTNGKIYLKTSAPNRIVR